MVRPVLSIVSISALGLLLTGARFSSQADSSDGVPGYFNPHTHTFSTKVARNVTPDVTLKDYTGTLKFDYTLKVDTKVPSGQELLCEASTIVEDENGDGLFYQESASAVAKVSGTTGTCTVLIPYSWELGDGAADEVSVSYNLVIAPTSATSQFNEYPTRTHETATVIKVPTTIGSTTTVAISATL